MPNGKRITVERGISTPTLKIRVSSCDCGRKKFSILKTTIYLMNCAERFGGKIIDNNEFPSLKDGDQVSMQFKVRFRNKFFLKLFLWRVFRPRYTVN